MFVCQKCELMPSCMYPAERDRVFILLHSKVIPLSELSCKSSRITNNKVTLAKPSIAFRRNTEASGSKIASGHCRLSDGASILLKPWELILTQPLKSVLARHELRRKENREKKALNKFTKKKMYKINGNCLCSLHRVCRSFVIMKMNLRPWIDLNYLN